MFGRKDKDTQDDNEQKKNILDKEFSIVPNGLDEKEVSEFFQDFLARQKSAQQATHEMVRSLIDRAVSDAERFSAVVKTRAAEEARQETETELREEYRKKHSDILNSLLDTEDKGSPAAVMLPPQAPTPEPEKEISPKEAKQLAREEAKRRAEEEKKAEEERKQAEKEAKLAAKEEEKRLKLEAKQADEARKQAEKEAKLAAREEEKRLKLEAKEEEKRLKQEAREANGKQPQAQPEAVAEPEKEADFAPRNEEPMERASGTTAPETGPDNESLENERAARLAQMLSDISPGKDESATAEAPTNDESTMAEAPTDDEAALDLSGLNREEEEKEVPAAAEEAAASPTDEAVPEAVVEETEAEPEKGIDTTPSEDAAANEEAPTLATDDGALYSGEIELSVGVPVNPVALSKLYNHLQSTADMKILYTKGSWDKGTTITVSLEKPLPFMGILNRIPGITVIPQLAKKESGGKGGNTLLRSGKGEVTRIALTLKEG